MPRPRASDLAAPTVDDVVRSPGQPLDPGVRELMEPRFAHDFSGVQVHADPEAAASARSMGARAYTIGRHVVFGPGEYRPQTASGAKLLAHELTHVVQQEGHGGLPNRPLDLSRPGDASEAEAEEIGRSVAGASGERVRRPGHRTELQVARQKLSPFVDKFFDDEEDLLARGPLVNPLIGHPWPDLPRAQRDAKHEITVKKGTPAKGKTPAVQNVAVVPDVAKPTLDGKQQAIVDQIKKNRDALPDLLSGTPAAGATGSAGVGYMYGGKNPGKPTSVKAGGTDPKSTREKWIWEEVGGEGGSSSINTWDNMHVTYGKGFAASTTLPGVLNALFAKDPAAKAMLEDVGVALDGSEWMVVNTDLGAVEVGMNALRLLETSPKLLSVLITIGEDPAHAQVNLDVQWAKVMAAAGKYPAYAETWSETAFKVGFHMAHWLPAYGWGSVDYKPTGGDILKIVKTFAKATAGRTQPNGAYLVPAQWGLVTHLRSFGGGAGLRAIESSGATAPVTIDKEKTTKDAAWKDKILIPDGKDAFRVLDAS